MFLRFIPCWLLLCAVSHVIVVFRVKTRCKHYMIDQTRSGKFVIVGMSRVYKSLKEMVTVHKKVQTSVRSCLQSDTRHFYGRKLAYDN